MGVVLVIENIEDKDPQIRVALARSFDSERSASPSTPDMPTTPMARTGAPPVDYYVHAAGDMLHHVHLQDSDGYADRHWNPGEGNIAVECQSSARSSGSPATRASSSRCATRTLVRRAPIT
jgi:hypothetical protein